MQLLIFLLSLTSSLLLTACSDDSPSIETGKAEAPERIEADVVARIGDETITFGQLNAMLNSTAVAGMQVPELGTPERTQTMVTLLDNAISANLLYLDAKKKGVDRLSAYKEDVSRFEDAMLASMYRNSLMQGETQVSDIEVLHHYNTRTGREVELDDETRLAIEAIIRKQKLDAFEISLRDRIREGVDVVIKDKVLAAEYDNKRSDADVVATYDSHRVSWSQVRELMQNASRNPTQTGIYITDNEERKRRLDGHLDNAIMALKGRAAGLENDPVYIKRTTEYRKARLVNEHRNGLLHSWNPDQDQLQAFFDSNTALFTRPAARRVQMVTVETREEAASILEQINNSEISLEQAAMQHSIDPQTRHTLGHVGWINKGSGFDDINDLIFEMEPGVVNGPVESDAGWNLLKVVDSVAAQAERLDDPPTRQRAFQAYMQERFNEYVVDLRKNAFEVVVYHDELDRQFQREADFVAGLNARKQQETSTTEQRINELQESITTLPRQ